MEGHRLGLSLSGRFKRKRQVPVKGQVQRENAEIVAQRKMRGDEWNVHSIGTYR